jgi:hypothetical protein
MVLASSVAQAAPLTASPPGFLTPVPTEPDPGAAALVTTRTENFTGLGFSGVLISSVYQGNQFGNDALTFTYRLSNDASSTNVLHRLTVSSFETFLTDVSIQAGGVPPTLADRSTPDVVGFSFLDGLGQGPIRAGGQSSLLVVETNSRVWTGSTASVIDGSTATVATYAPFPAIPEPSTCALGILGALGLIGVARRTRG